MRKCNHIYTIPAVVSLSIHLAFLGGLSRSITMPAIDFAHTEKKIELELVDNPPVQDSTHEDVETNLISDFQQKARDHASEKEGALMPSSDGETRSKNLVESGSAVSTDELLRDLKEQIETLESLTEGLQKDQAKIQVQKAKEPEKSPEEIASKTDPALSSRAVSEEKRKLFENIESEVADLGDPMFATRYDLVVPYLRAMREAIFEAWYPVISMQAGPMPDSRAVVEFKIKPDGQIIDLEVSSLQGSIVFGDMCAAAVQKAAPFEPIPIEFPLYLKNNFFHIKFTFYYD